jgi:FtsP/CotA-like multicopper oxidase with cupredoxin domain
MPARVASYNDLVGVGEVASGRAARATVLKLGMGGGRYRWTIGGQAFPDAEPLRFARGEPVRLAMRNATMMPHPMHLHGHFFRAVTPGGRGPRKDTILVPPMATTVVEFVADNPGRWAFHCHNAYHAEAGMMRVVEVADA